MLLTRSSINNTNEILDKEVRHCFSMIHFTIHMGFINNSWKLTHFEMQ